MCTEICIHLRWKLVVAANPRSICDVTDEDLLLPLPPYCYHPRTPPLPPSSSAYYLQPFQSFASLHSPGRVRKRIEGNT